MQDLSLRETPLTPELWLAIVGQFKLPRQSPHGPAHWMRVRHNGLLLAEKTGANRRVVELFAVFHDSCRENEHRDPAHGPNAAVLAHHYFEDGLFECTEHELETLLAACYGHTHQRHHPDPTIATCWDADRLDLPRVGIETAPHRLCTAAARSEAMIDHARSRAEYWVGRRYG